MEVFCFNNFNQVLLTIYFSSTVSCLVQKQLYFEHVLVVVLKSTDGKTHWKLVLLSNSLLIYLCNYWQIVFCLVSGNKKAT